jgi:hypothetical protein
VFVEDDTMDRSEPREALDGVPAPEVPEPQRTVDQDGQRALPAPDPAEYPLPDRIRGRHEAPQRTFSGPAGAAIAVVIASVVFAGVLATWLISSAEEPDGPAEVATSNSAGPTSRPSGAGSFGNLVLNWSFEEDLSGWQVLGPADGSREPQGRTSGSCASVRAHGLRPARVGLALPDVAPDASKGQRYVASAWVRSAAPGQQVTLQVIGAGGKEVSKATVATRPGLDWKRVIVDHTVATAGPLRLELVADGVPAGETLMADEVVVRLG